MTFNHGQYCDVTESCSSAGIARVYYDAVSNNSGVAFLYDREYGWAGEIDRHFPLRDMFGQLNIISGKYFLTGRYGNELGRFNVSRRCQATTGTYLLVHLY